MAPSKSPHRPRGRPRSHGERVALGLRVTPEMKTRLDEAAKASGRSLSQEAELRLEATFTAENAVLDALDLAYGRRLTGLFLALAQTAQMAGTRGVFVSRLNVAGAEDWFDDPYAYDQALRGVSFLLKCLRPEGDARAPERAHGLPRAALEQLGEGSARMLIAALESAPQKAGQDDRTKPIRERLADVLDRMHVPPDDPIA